MSDDTSNINQFNKNSTDEDAVQERLSDEIFQKFGPERLGFDFDAKKQFVDEKIHQYGENVFFEACNTLAGHLRSRFDLFRKGRSLSFNNPDISEKEKYDVIVALPFALEYAMKGNDEYPAIVASDYLTSPAFCQAFINAQDPEKMPGRHYFGRLENTYHALIKHERTDVAEEMLRHFIVNIDGKDTGLSEHDVFVYFRMQEGSPFEQAYMDQIHLHMKHWVYEKDCDITFLNAPLIASAQNREEPEPSGS